MTIDSKKPLNPTHAPATPAAAASFKSLLVHKKAQPAAAAPELAQANRAVPPGLVSARLATRAGLAMQVDAHAQAQSLSVEVASQARGHIEQAATQLTQVRSATQAHGQQQAVAHSQASKAAAQQINERAVELIARELESAFSGVGSRAANDRNDRLMGKGSARANVQAAAMDSSNGHGKPLSPPVARSTEAPGLGLDVETKAAQAAALIEKIEVFVKSNQRPALALTLNNSLGARVEIERIGPGEVALKLVGHHGPPSPEAVSRIRDEMTARGLRVAALSVA